ncbi:MAG TPA: DoxX family protein [Allosphingosinicella sp.]|nr:DoxX family protein [Allosphingosinicella sp.]
MTFFNLLARYRRHLQGVLRIVAGLLFLSHGLAKLFGFPAGAAPGQQPLFTLLGAAGAIELVAGILITIGLFSRQAAFIASGEMAVAYWAFHAGDGFFPIVNMGETAILYCFLFLFFAAAGPGAFGIEGTQQRTRPFS